MKILDSIRSKMSTQSDPEAAPESVPADAVLEEKIGTAQIADARIRLQKYKSGKTALENRIVENEKWWRLRHNRPKDDNSIEATSGWLFNCIISKHADAMDSYQMCIRDRTNTSPHRTSRRETVRMIWRM